MTSVLSPDERRDARLAVDAPRVPWDEFTMQHFVWERGEHVGLIGPTGQGKTSLLKEILPAHPYVTVFATKPRDESLEGFEQLGYHRIEKWQSEDPRIHPRRLLWPNASRLGAHTRQSEVFGDAMDRIYREGKWTVTVDELMYLVQRLKLRGPVQDFYTQARSLRISFVASTQRPAWVPGEMYDQSTHLFMWHNNDGRALQRLGEINVRDRELVRHIVGTLDQFQTLYINTRTGFMCRTRAPRPERRLFRGDYP